MQTKFLAAFTVTLLVAGCAAQQPPMVPLNTPSGRPEVHIDGKTQQQIIDGIVEFCANKGDTIDSQTASMVVCSRVIDDYKTKVALRYQYGNGQLILHNQVLVSKEDAGFRLMLSSTWIDVNSPTGATQRVPVTIDRGPAATADMASLEHIKASILAQTKH